MKILVIDDEEMIRELAEMVLVRAGHEVLLAENGEKGIEIFNEHHTDIMTVLLDINMEGLSGYDTLRALREIKETIPCIFSTGEIISNDDLPEDIKHNCYILQKPYRSTELNNFINQIVWDKNLIR